MLERDQDRDDGLFLIRLVNIHAVFVMQGDDLLADDGDDLVMLVPELEVQGGDVAAQDPAEAFDIRDIFDKMPELVGKLERRSVGHGNEMALMQGEKLALNMGDLVSCRIRNVIFSCRDGNLVQER